LGLVPVHPNWAGHAASILSSLRPIGGVDASFFGTSTLQESIAYILTDATARNSVVGVAARFAQNCTLSRVGVVPIWAPPALLHHLLSLRQAICSKSYAN
jgi:hypothetical protein